MLIYSVLHRKWNDAEIVNLKIFVLHFGHALGVTENSAAILEALVNRLPPGAEQIALDPAFAAVRTDGE